MDDGLQDQPVQAGALKTKTAKKAKKRVKKAASAKMQEESSFLGKYGLYAIIAVALFILFNQVQISRISGLAETTATQTGATLSLGGKDLSQVDVSQIQSTAQGIAALFPVESIKTTEDAIAVMVPTGTPDYGAAMGVSFDDPVNSLNLMARGYGALNKQIQQNPEQWERFMNLASEPKGVSCEYCCGVGPVGVTKSGQSRCGCQHHPALLTLTQWLIMNTEYTDAEILREVYKWKTLFFPKNMIVLATQIAGGDTSVLENLPGMVGGC